MIVATFFIFLDMLLFVLSGLIIVRMIASWFTSPQGKLLTVLTDLTEPVVSPVRRLVPLGGSIDFAPLITLLLMDALRYALFYL